MAESILNNRSCSDSIVFLSASELSALSTDARTALYQGGARQLVVENDDTITTHVLKEDGSTVWMGSNKPVVNLLDNSDFTNTVNQRGSLNYVGNWGYGPDRWFVVTTNSQSPADQSIWIDPLWVNMNYYHELIQKIEWKKVAGKTLTLAAENSQGARQVVGGIKVPTEKDMTQSMFYGSVWGDNYILEGISYTNDSCFDVRIRSAYNGWQGLRWAALYEGTYNDETCPPYTPKGYAAELRECQRYYQIIHTGYPTLGTCYTTTANTANIRFPIPVPMVTTPTTSVEASSIGICLDGNAPQATSLLIGGMTNTSIDMTLTFSSNYFEGKIFYVGAPFSTANIELNADL